jgi:hypothetical protein
MAGLKLKLKSLTLASPYRGAVPPPKKGDSVVTPGGRAGFLWEFTMPNGSRSMAVLGLNQNRATLIGTSGFVANANPRLVLTEKTISAKIIGL